MGRKKFVKKGKPKARRRVTAARTVPPPASEPYVPNWGDVDPAIYEDLLEWVDTVEID